MLGCADIRVKLGFIGVCYSAPRHMNIHEAVHEEEKRVKKRKMAGSTPFDLRENSNLVP